MGMFKVRFSYGKVGNDKIRHNNADVRFPYLYAIGEGNSYDWANYGSSYGFTGLTYTELASDQLLGRWATKKRFGE